MSELYVCGAFAVYAKFAMPLRALLLIVVLLGCRAAFALSPPLITDDPETPGPDGWEINIASSIEQTRGATAIEAPLIDINYGFGKNDQLKVEFAVDSIDETDQENHWGISDLLVGYKYRFLEEDEGIGWQVSFYPQVACPTGNADLGIGEGSTQLEIPFQFGKHFCNEKLYVNPEIGYNIVFEDDNRNSWKFGLAAEVKAGEKLELMGEVGAFVFPQNSEPDDPFFNFGFEYIINKHIALLGSAGRSFRPRSDGTPDLIALFGFEFTFGGPGEESEGGADGRESGDGADGIKDPARDANSSSFLRSPTASFPTRGRGKLLNPAS